MYNALVIDAPQILLNEDFTLINSSAIDLRALERTAVAEQRQIGRADC